MKAGKGDHFEQAHNPQAAVDKNPFHLPALAGPQSLWIERSHFDPFGLTRVKPTKRLPDSPAQVTSGWKRVARDQNSVLEFVELEDTCGLESSCDPSELRSPSAMVGSQ